MMVLDKVQVEGVGPVWVTKHSSAEVNFIDDVVINKDKLKHMYKYMV